MKNRLQNKVLSTFVWVLTILISVPVVAQTVPSDLMDNCKQWKITYPTGIEDKTLCGEANNEFFYVNGTGDAIVFRAPIRSDNGTTPKSDNIRSELREREVDGSVDVYWTTEGSHLIYVKQAITHLPINKPQLVATQIHGNKEEGIDDSMVLRLEGTHLFLSFNGGKLRDNVTIKTNYALGTLHEVIFNVINGKHYCYYSEDGNLLNAYNNGNADQYLVKADGNDYVMDLSYDESYFKVGNYTQSNAVEEGTDTDNPDNYGEVLVYDFFVNHNDDVSVTGVSISPASIDLVLGNTFQLNALVSPVSATNLNVSFSSSDNAVATVDANGLVKAISKGSAIITVATSEGGFTNSSTINVVEAAVGSNLALNKAVIGTGTPDGEHVVANLVDGLTSTRWSVSGFPQTATIDLGEIYTIDRTELVAYTDRAYNYTVAVATSENGPFTQIIDRSENTSPATELNPNINIFSEIDARFVKVTVTGSENYTGDWISLLEFRVFGISTSVADDDDDGVLNSNDKCPNTSIGTSVDANGCALLESNNFKIEVLGETCSGKNNGKIVIAAAKSQDYTLTYNSETFSFTSGKILENISPGTYSFCIEVIGVTSPYCYTVVIPEATTISGKSTLTNKQLFVNISKGTLPYKVIVNGSLQFKTFDNDFNLEVNHGDLVEVKTAVECEGVYSKNIELFNSLNVYPNPSMGLFSIPIETNHKTVEISVFNTVSKLVLSKTYNVINSKVQLDLTHKPRGIYFVKVHLDKDYIFKVVKH
ncbi:polysaccharide lyase family 7 protein [Lutibacter sp. A80]|uniref:polysaccharide lyase family 7 protein n=1 Tax=Lutibacter sp. A80 TaxID=2918453 RepID=UPI002738A2E8|nr:polysaccharide lyase family 7 protein [Lutibacter sp. A80]